MGALRTEIMEKRIKFFSAITIFVIIVATITALFVTDAKDLASVKNVKMAHNSENSISLRLKKPTDIIFTTLTVILTNMLKSAQARAKIIANMTLKIFLLQVFIKLKS